MHQPGKWWIGLPALAGLAYFAAQALTPQIEADLKNRLAARLSPSATIEVSGRDAAISGPAPTAQESGALRAEPGLRKISIRETAVAAPPPAAAPPPPEPGKAAPPPPRDPYVFSAALGEAVVALDGKLPNADIQKQAVALASSIGAGLPVSDGAKIDAGAPPGDYARAIEAAFHALGTLARGKASLADNRLSIEGAGRANVRAERVAEEVKARLPAGFELARIDVAPGPVSPYVFTAVREGAGATLTGFAPDEATRKRLVEAARRRFFDATVEDRLEVAQGAPQKFTEAAEVALAALARLDHGKLAMSDADVSLFGAARYELARADVAKALEETTPSGFKSDVRLTTQAAGAPLDAAGCRAAFAELSKAPLKFEADDSAVADESMPLVDAMTATVLRCQTVPIEVAGHSDDQGAAEINLDRSKRRARLLVDRFVKAGADSFRVWATGYGGERPVALNDDENRARNWRIEFIVK